MFKKICSPVCSTILRCSLMHPMDSPYPCRGYFSGKQINDTSASNMHQICNTSLHANRQRICNTSHPANLQMGAFWLCFPYSTVELTSLTFSVLFLSVRHSFAQCSVYGHSFGTQFGLSFALWSMDFDISYPPISVLPSLLCCLRVILFAPRLCGKRVAVF